MDAVHCMVIVRGNGGGGGGGVEGVRGEQGKQMQVQSTVRLHVYTLDPVHSMGFLGERGMGHACLSLQK